VQAPHIIEGVQGSNSGTNFVYNESTRVVAIDGNASTSIVRCGANGVIEKGTHIYTSTSIVDTVDAGGTIRSKGTTLRDVQRRETSPNFEVFYQMSNTQAGYNDWAWCAGSAANDIALRNITASYNALYFENGAGANIGVNGKSFGGGEKVIFIANASIVPNSNPSLGGILYVDSGALKYRGSSGTVTTLAVA